VTIGPEMAVDASERQITADHTLSALPASLAALTLFEPYGELVDAAGGVVEYSDLLKRPLDAWKYLLLAIEHGEVSLPMSNLALNSVMVASSNEVHLRAFREHHDYNSFRGRLQLIRVPYLLDYRQEQGIYDAQIVPQVTCHVAPHTTYVVALWAVLTRLRRAQPDQFANATLGRVAADLAPLEKAELYASGAVPPRLSSDDARELSAGVLEVLREGAAGDSYEGLDGASPREIRGILLDAANEPKHDCLSPLAVLEAVDSFCQRNDFDFLRQTADRGYYDHRGFVRLVRSCWLDRVDHEVRVATGLIDETQYLDLFARYVTHVSFWLKGEKVRNPITGKDQEPDSDLMEGVESTLGVERSAREFRNDLISAIAAHAIDHPGTRPDPAKLFPRHLERLREAYYEEKRDQVATILRDVLSLVDDAPVPEARAERARATLERFRTTFGYETSSVKVTLGELVKQRYT
ncbi:MAG: serine protein kinase PrkA, partial [Myxococcales bacterium]|nr:serine protein kinase PrkA [Myxococcales bacterium]